MEKINESKEKFDPIYLGDYFYHFEFMVVEPAITTG